MPNEPEDLPEYNLADLKDMYRVLNDILVLLESKPHVSNGRSGAFQKDVNLRQKGITATFKWKPAIPVLPSISSRISAQNFAELATSPFLTLQLLQQCIKLMEKD